MAANKSDIRGAAAPTSVETPDDLIEGALSDAALNSVSGGGMTFRKWNDKIGTTMEPPPPPPVKT
jgi:hypothetical protein